MDVRRHCRGCLVCATRKGPSRRAQPPFQPLPIGGPFHRVGVDVLQLPLSFEGNKYAVVFMDYFTKWPDVFAVPDQQATAIARLLVEEIIVRHGVPEQLLSEDQTFRQRLLVKCVNCLVLKRLIRRGIILKQMAWLKSLTVPSLICFPKTWT